MSLPLDEDYKGKILSVPKKDEGPQYTKKGTLRLRRPKTKNQYFTRRLNQPLQQSQPAASRFITGAD